MARRILARFAFLACSLVQLAAQVTTATLYTITTDPSGAVVPGATVILRDERTGSVRRQACDNLGECSFQFLRPGTYSGSISASGFKTLEISSRKPPEVK
ncbi:MAG: carboxypeptidase regulatory-like domain-containing protein [Acidobacteria bacterium]|nr:carboxypeptidase regulatory-like domain-containing protein [Acidobacteriota bacterium]